MPYNIMRFSY